MAQERISTTPARGEFRLARHNPTGFMGSPLRSLQRVTEEIDRVFEDFGLGRRSMNAPFWQGQDAWAPEVEVVQKDHQLVVRADLPGLKRDEVSVEVHDGAVTIQGERQRQRDEEREGIYRSERSYGSFYRVVPLPDGAIADEAKASFRDGVLEITMPAPPAPQGRRLEITEGTKK